MIITLKDGTRQEEKEQLMSWISGKGLDVDASDDGEHEFLRLIGDTDLIDVEMVALLDMVRGIRRVNEPYKKANRLFHPNDTIVNVGGVKIGGGNYAVIAGPCSVESEEQIVELAKVLKDAGASLLRGGAFKAATTGVSFQRMNQDVIKLLLKAKAVTGLPIVTEIINEAHLPLFDEVDMIQVGARNMQNYELLKALGKSNKPILLKRGLSNTIEDLLMSAEYIISYGNNNVVLCERGIRTFETHTNATLDMSAVPALHTLTHLPVIVDPSHSTGKAEYSESMALAATACGADGISIEVHNDPSHALYDGPMSINPVRFAKMMKKIEGIREVIL